MGNEEQMTDAQRDEAVLRSGYLLEYRVGQLLEKLGWSTQVNAPFLDARTNVSREFDVLSLQGEQAGPHDADVVFGVLLIECINNPQPLACFVRTGDLLLPEEWLVKLSGTPIKLPPSSGVRALDQWTPLPVVLRMHEYHHACLAGQFATQYCSFEWSKHKKKWMALHDEAHFGVLSVLIAATQYHIEVHYSSWSPGKPEQEPINIQMYYPILVLQGELLSVRPTRRGLLTRSVSHVRLRYSVVRAQREEYYMIDIVTERAIRRLVRTIANEVTETARRLCKPTMSRRMKQGARLLAKAARKQSDCRAVFEY